MPQTVTQAVAKRESGPVSVMWGRRKHFAAVLPRHVDVESFLGTAAAALHANPKLAEAAAANPDSLIAALMRCAALGHQPGTDEFYLLWRRIKDPDDSGRKRPAIQGIEGYRGIIERMYRSGAVATVIVREVCARDYFRYVEGEDERPVHRFAAREGTTGADFFGDNGSVNRGPMVGVYAVARFVTGAWSRPALLTRDDVMAARESSTAKDSAESPWNKLDAGPGHPEFQGRSMWWKTAARRLEPWVPTSAEYRREIARAAAKASGLDRPPAAVAAARRDDDIVDAELVDDGPAGREEGHRAPATTAREGGGPPLAGTTGTVRPSAPPGEAPAATSPDGGAHPVTPLSPGGTGDGDPAGGGTADPRIDGPAASPIDQVQQRRINALFRQMEWTDREDRLRAASALTGREITALTDLTGTEASALVETLARISRQPDPVMALTTAVAGARDKQRKDSR